MIPKASFVIATHNDEAYLPKAINSCLGQSLKRVEIIVVDDGSTDGTPDLLSHYQKQDKRIRVVRLEQNQGRSAARNRGIQEAKSDVIMILDSDDVALADRAAITVKHFKKTADDVVYGQFVTIDALGNVTGSFDALPFNFEKVKETGYTFICHSTMAFRKSVFDKVQYSLDGYSANGIDDWKFQVDAFRAGLNLGVIKKPLCQYRDLGKAYDTEEKKKLKDLCLNAN